MKGLLPLFFGLFATFAFSWVGLALIPNFQIGHLNPQSDEEGTDVYPVPASGMAERGRHIYAANGCFYCHSQQMRPDYAASDLDRTRDLDKSQKWGVRRSAPRDYVFDRPVLLGKDRNGPDLANIGKTSSAEEQSAPAPGVSPAASPAASPGQNASPASPAPGVSPATSASPSAAVAAASPSASTAGSPASASPSGSATPGQSPPPPGGSPAASSTISETKPGEPLPYSTAWHHQHLYAPRSINPDSNMPAYRFLYEKRRIAGEPSLDALTLTGRDALPDGWEIIPTYDAKCLVAFLMSRDQSHPLNEVKPTGGAPAAPAAPAASAAPPSSPAPSPAEKGAPK
jgi:cbb3-type cytochrome oxidase cytochrome c subunit